jgi:drug/metabolite transporter (DMT)-like permease
MKDLREPLLGGGDHKKEAVPKLGDKGKRDSEGFRTPRWLGYVYMLIFIIMICMQQLLGKILFTRTPQMTATQLLFLRSITAAIIFGCLMNKNIKYYMYTSIERRHIGHLAARVLQGLLMLVCIYTSVKYLPLVYTSLTSNLGPLLTAVFSYIFLKKGLSKIDVVILVISFLGVVFMILGSFQSDSPAPTNPGLQPASLWIPVLAMLAVPILAASQSIVLR